nr:reverse transcriptase domain-containing protein [Tanacetum cinerariifolium]
MCLEHSKGILAVGLNNSFFGHGSSYYFYFIGFIQGECGSHAPRVILFGTISAIISVILEVPIAPVDLTVASKVGAVSVISPTRVLDLVDYSSSSNSDPSEDSLPVAPELPLVSPFLCTDDLEADSESEPAEQRPERHESLTSSSEFLLVPVFATPGILRRPSILVRPGEAIPFGRPYRTHPNRPRKLLTARKRVRSFPARRLAWRWVSHRSLDRHSSQDLTSHLFSSSLSSDSSSDISSGSSSERSLDSSSPSAGPSRKRCRSPATLVPSSTPVSRSIAPALADLPPRKRFKDSYSSKVSGKEHMEMGTADVETVADLGISEGVGALTKDGIDLGVEVANSDIREDEEEFEAEASRGGIMGIVLDPFATSDIFDPTGGDAPDLEETGQLEASNERAGLADRVRSLGWENLRVRALLCIKRDRVDNLRRHMAFSQEEFCQVRRDRDVLGGDLGGWSHLWRDVLDFARTMTITCSGMTSEAIEELVNRRVGEALDAYEATRAANALKTKSQTQNGSDGDNRNGRNRNGRIRNPKGNDRELTMLCTKMVLEEQDRVEKFIGGLPDNIQGNVIAAEPTRLQDAVRIANNLIDQNLKGYAMKNAENKRKFDNSRKDNRGQQPPFKRQNVRGQNVARAYKAGNIERRVYNGPLPLYNKCKFHHEGPCTVRCRKCNKFGHLTRDYKATKSTTSTQRDQVVNQRVVTCYECERQGHYRNGCPKLKDQNHGDKTGNKNGISEARGKAYVLGGGDANPESNVITSMFLLNNHYAYILFDLGIDQSFVSTNFSILLDKILDTLDVSYVVELADERISETNTVLKDCTLGLLSNLFDIDLMPVELGSFDFIIGMDWLANHHAVIVCDEKIVRIPYGSEVLIVQGDRSGKGKTSISII